MKKTTTISELKAVIKLMRQNKITELELEGVKLKVDPSIYLIEMQKSEFNIQSAGANEPTKEGFALPIVREEDLTGPFPYA